MVEPLFFLLILTLFITLFVTLFSMVFRKKLTIERRVNRYFIIEEKEKIKKKGKVSALSSPLLQKYWYRGTKYVNRSYAKKDQIKLEDLLRGAGVMKISAVEFRLLQLLISLGSGIIVFLLFAPISQSWLNTWLLVGAVFFLGFRYPIFYLGKKKTERVKKINREMADFFDMVSLLLEAGVGLESALADVCAKAKGPLSEEFQLTLQEMRHGKSRRDAFYSLRKRIPSERFQSVVMSIIQADQLGVGMARVVKNLTSHIRDQQREAAREQAMKAPVKMLFPMLIFIFPSIFIVILGPLVVKLITEGL